MAGILDFPVYICIIIGDFVYSRKHLTEHPCDGARSLAIIGSDNGLSVRTSVKYESKCHTSRSWIFAWMLSENGYLDALLNDWTHTSKLRKYNQFTACIQTSTEKQVCFAITFLKGNHLCNFRWIYLMNGLKKLVTLNLFSRSMTIYFHLNTSWRRVHATR